MDIYIYYLIVPYDLFEEEKREGNCIVWLFTYRFVQIMIPGS